MSNTPTQTPSPTTATATAAGAPVEEEQFERGRSPAERLAKPPATLMETAVLISQGAEARVFRVVLPPAAQAATAATTAIVKERFAKHYRHPELDKRLTAQRIRSEVRNMARAAKGGVRVPRALYVDKAAGRIVMEDLGPETVKARLWAERAPDAAAVIAAAAAASSSSRGYSAAATAMCTELGRVVGKLHAADVCHGDLTTSNFIVLPPSLSAEPEGAQQQQQLAPIDFGLSFISASLEDKAVDLYVLERAFLCTHLESAALVQAVLDGYKQTYAKGAQVLQRLEHVRARGRKKLAFG